MKRSNSTRPKSNVNKGAGVPANYSEGGNYAASHRAPKINTVKRGKK